MITNEKETFCEAYIWWKIAFYNVILGKIQTKHALQQKEVKLHKPTVSIDPLKYLTKLINLNHKNPDIQSTK